MFERMKKQTRGLLTELIRIVYFMRGGIQYHDVLSLTPTERDMFSEFIEHRLEQEAKKLNPVY